MFWRKRNTTATATEAASEPIEPTAKAAVEPSAQRDPDDDPFKSGGFLPLEPEPEPQISDEERTIWQAQWAAQGMPWRTEPEISAERQAFLAERRTIKRAPMEGIYAFSGIRLFRADIEWLLATAVDDEGRIGPADHTDPNVKERKLVFDLSGADLRKVNLSRLPMARTGGATLNDDIVALHKQGRDDLAYHGFLYMQGANLRETHLEGSYIVQARMDDADLTGAFLDKAALYGCHFERAKLVGAHLDIGFLAELQANDADFSGATITADSLLAGSFRRANFSDARIELGLSGDDRRPPNRDGGKNSGFTWAHMEEANFTRAWLVNVNFDSAHCERANFTDANLTGAYFTGTYLDGAVFTGSVLADADLTTAIFTDPTIIVEGQVSQTEQQITAAQGKASVNPWVALGMPWRREPEIDAERKAFLSERRSRAPDELRNSFAFTGEALTRADVEWLLASHDNGRGPIDPDDATQRERAGLDLRGADLRNVDLSGLPLAQLRAGVFLPAYRDSMDARRATGYTDFESANLTRTQLQRADLANANFDSARLEWAHLEGSDLHQARLTGIRGRWAYFEGADLHAASLRSAALDGAHFQCANLRGASLASTEATSADFADADLQDARFYAAALPQARFERANLRGAEFTDLRSLLIGRARMPADLHETHFEGATLADTQMHSVNLTQAHLEGADLQGARLEAANLSDATFAGADLRRVIFSDLSILERMTLTDAEHGPALLAGVDWNEADLAAVDWAQVPMLGDEALARRSRDANGASKSAQTRLAEYEDAIRAYQQLTVALDTLGLDELAAPYAYRARTLERHLLLRRIFWRGEVWRLGAYLFSAFLALLTGYGYRLQRILIAYVSVVLACAIIFFALGVTGFGGQSVSPTEALLLSITAFHGRVFSAPVALGIAQQWVAAAEAVAGLLIESVFVAMLTQRFFGR